MLGADPLREFVEGRELFVFGKDSRVVGHGLLRLEHWSVPVFEFNPLRVERRGQWRVENSCFPTQAELGWGTHFRGELRIADTKTKARATADPSTRPPR